MTETKTPSTQEWTTPELVKLGTMRDIAQQLPPANQANTNKRS